MNPDQAREILLLYRPGATEEDLPGVTEALELAREDAALEAWLNAHCALQDKIEGSLRDITVPAGLDGQIISENPARARVAPWKKALVAVAAVVILWQVGLFASRWMQQRQTTSYAAFRTDMAYIAASGYGMNLTTNDLGAIHAYLADAKFPADYSLPEGLKKLDALGCMTTTWQGHQVSLLCFRTPASSRAGQAGDVWLFVGQGRVSRDAPLAAAPKYETVGDLGTASWADNGKTYLLAARGGKPVVGELLGIAVN